MISIFWKLMERGLARFM